MPFFAIFLRCCFGRWSRVLPILERVRRAFRPRPLGSSPVRRRRALLELESLEGRLTPSGYSFSDLASFHGSDGANPQGGLIRDSQGNLFGTTYSGGASNNGTVYELPAGSSTVRVLASFNGMNGSGPVGNLTLDSHGNLFGATSGGFGPSNDGGEVFELPAGSSNIKILAGFIGGNGGSPNGSLILDGSGNLFGTTASGGAYGQGTIFELPAGTASVLTLASFNTSWNGATPHGSLVMDSHGNLFGTTSSGGARDYGAVFELPAGSSTIINLASFNGSNGSVPNGSLVMDSKGDFFGTTQGGGQAYGTVFELPAGSSTIINLASFNGTNGDRPVAGLVRDSSGNLFGTTYRGGANGDGVVFELPAGSSSILDLHAFSGTDGNNPVADLIQDSSGNLYGTTASGGSNGVGVVYDLGTSAAVSLHLAITTPSQTLTAGTPSGPITVQLENQYGQPVAASANLTINLSSNGGGTFLNGSISITSITITAGSNQASFKYENTRAGTATLTAAAAGLAPTTQQETVKPAAASQLAFITAAQTLYPDVASAAITVQLQDRYGNAVTASSPLTVSLSSTSSKGVFLSNGRVITSIPLPAGSSTVTLSYKDTQVGKPTLTALIQGLTAARQTETVL